jgi:hypothetical protein
MTTAALKGIDVAGGIDRYIMSLDEPSVKDSNYVTKIRSIIGRAMFLQGKLDPKMIGRLGFDVNPPAEMPAREEYYKEERSPYPRIRKMRAGWTEPRYY